MHLVPRGSDDLPEQVLLKAGHGGLSADSLAQCEQVRAVAKTRLIRHRGSLSGRAIVAVSTALARVLDLAP